jgi:hypothetical protein
MAAELFPKLDGFARALPILRWLPGYHAGWLRADIIAGLTLWGILVPEGIAYARTGWRAGSSGALHTPGLPRRLRHPRNSPAGGLGPDLRVVDHDGYRRRTVHRSRAGRIGRATRIIGPCCGDYLPAVWADAARLRDRVHFAFGHDRFRLRAGDLYRRHSSSQILRSAQGPRRHPLSALVSHWAAGGGQLDDFRHRGGPWPCCTSCRCALPGRQDR